MCGTGAVPTWDLQWSRSVPRVSRIWALPLTAGLALGAMCQPGDAQVTVWLLCTLVPQRSLGIPVPQGDRDGDPPRLSATFGLVVCRRELSYP